MFDQSFSVENYLSIFLRGLFNVKQALLYRKVCGLRGPSKWCYFAWEHILLCPRRYLTFFSGI